MAFQNILGVVLFTLLFLALMPGDRFRKTAVWLLGRIVHVAMFVVVGLLYLLTFSPQTIPGELTRSLEPDLKVIRNDVPGFGIAEKLLGSTWLVVAVLIVFVGLPLLFRFAVQQPQIDDRDPSADANRSRQKPTPHAAGSKRNVRDGGLLIKDIMD